MKLSICLLTGTKHQSLGAFLLHLDCDVKVYTELTDFLSDAIAQSFQLIFLDESFLKSEQDFQRLRIYLSKTKKVRLLCLTADDKVFKLPNSGFVSSEDLNAVKNIVEDSRTLCTSDVQELVTFDDEAEVVEFIEEEVIDDHSERVTKGFLNIKKAQSLDELGVNLVWSLGHILKEGRKGVYFKYLPTYCSLVALDGFNFTNKKINGVGLNFSSSKDFNASQHLNKLQQVPAFVKVVERVFGHDKIDLRTLECDGEVKGVLVYEPAPQRGADLDLKVMCDYAEAKLSSIVYKHKYIQNKSKDELTGCILKEGFFNQLQNELMRAKRVLLPVTVMLFEIDHFYGLKTRYNQERVRTLVKSFAKILQDNVRHNDLVGCFGESKFAVLFPHMSTGDAYIKAQKLSKLIAQTQFFSDMKKRLICSASIALGTYPTQISSADELMVSLDSVLAHKESGGSLVVLKPKPGFVKDFEEHKLPDSAMNRKRTAIDEQP